MSWLLKIFIGKLSIFPFMCAADNVWITELTLIHKNIRSVRSSYAQELTDIKQLLVSVTSPIKAIMPVLKILLQY
jgi:hypothetical protein